MPESEPNDCTSEVPLIPGPKRRLRRTAVLGFFLVVILLLPDDSFRLSPGRAVGGGYIFSVTSWEIANAPDKWLHMLYNLLPGRKPSREERLELYDEYLSVTKKAQKEKDRLEGARIRGGTTLASGASKESPLGTDDYLKELVRARERLRPKAEEAIESEVSATLIDEGLGSRFGLIFPPVDLRFTEPPTLLIISPRDRIHYQEGVLLDPEIPVFERDELEKEVLASYDLSALVDNIAGLGTYPAMVSDQYTPRTIARTSVHEWLHHYFFFHPLGRNRLSSTEMFTLNETAADLAGRELGDVVFARMGGDLSISPSRYAPAEDRDPHFTREMRGTRREAEALLAEGKVDEAEELMRDGWWRLAIRGYGLRKLNQAYFAFRGSYAESPGSLSPIGDELEELRALLPDIGAFVRSVASVGNHEELLELLDRLRPTEPEGSTAASED